MRPDQALQTLSRAGTGPAPQQNIVFATKVIVSGPNGGEFVYNATRTVLESSNAGAATTDPILGFAVPQGFATYNAFGAVINLLSTSKSAFFQYFDNASAVQGALILAISSGGGTDPILGTTYLAGQYGIDPTFGDTINVIGANIGMRTVGVTAAGSVNAQPGSATVAPFLLVDAPEQTSAHHFEMQLTGASSDGTTQLAQMLMGLTAGTTHLTRQTNENVELQGSMALTGNIFPIVSAAEETWHTLPLTGTFAQNAGHTACQYRKLASPANCIQIKGDATVTSFSGNANITTALPAAYRPGVAQSSDFQVATSGQAPHYQLDTTGIFSIQQAGAGTTRVVFNELFSLDS